MPRSDPDTRLKVGALARETGLTVRALHHYEEIGLLLPRERTPAGHRLYGVDEVGRLHQIASLRQLGLSLEEIRAALDRPGASLEQVLALQMERLRRRIRDEEELLARLESLAERLRRDEADVSLRELARSVGETVRLERYYTTEQLQALDRRARELGPEAILASQSRWEEIFRGFGRAVTRGMPLDHPEVEALAREALALIRRFTGGDPEIAASLGALYREEGHQRVAEQHGMSIAPEVWAFAQRAMAAAAGADGASEPS
ncbi:MAG TPA: MerR family transcriptional regulator [Longimicrobiales bacterium]|nr:MerR family transcriptional regulator [Longimicrobiales bacterium]